METFTVVSFKILTLSKGLLNRLDMMFWSRDDGDNVQSLVTELGSLPALLWHGVIISRYMTQPDQYRTDTRIKHASGIIVKLYEWHRDGNLCHQNISENE